jgi:hypothetical protein
MIEHIVEISGAHVQRRLGVRHARIVDDDVDRPSLSKSGFNGGSIGHIERNGSSLQAFVLKAINQSSQPVQAPGRDDDAGARVRQDASEMLP